MDFLDEVQEAWDNLDPGLKQWIIAGVSMAVSFIPLVGPILACVVDGTFVDMINAIKNGDWAMLGMCALAFVPGGKALKGLKAVGWLGKNAEKQALKNLVLEKGGKSMLKHDAYKSSKHFAESSHLSDIAAKTRAGSVEQTSLKIQSHWSSAEFKGIQSGKTGSPYHVFESNDLRFVIDDNVGEIVTIYPFG